MGGIEGVLEGKHGTAVKEEGCGGTTRRGSGENGVEKCQGFEPKQVKFVDERFTRTEESWKIIDLKRILGR